MTTTRRRRQDTSNQVVQFTRTSLEYGKRKPWPAVLRNIAMSEVDKYAWQFRGNKDLVDGGFYPSGNIRTTTGTYANFLRLPIHCFDLLHRPANAQPTPYCPLQTMVIAPDGGPGAGKIQWLGNESMDLFGTPTNGLGGQWFVTDHNRGASSYTNMEPRERTHVPWISIRMNLFGATNRATRWLIEVVQLKDDELDPFTNDGETSDKHQAFWGSYVKQFTQNPIMHTTNPYRKDVKVMKSMSYIIQPNPTYDGDSTGQIKTLNFFMRLDRMVSYVEQTSPTGGQINGVTHILTQGEYTDNSVFSQTAKVNQSPDTKRKLILVVRNTDYSPIQTTYLPSAHGSFDLSVTRSEWI